MPFGRGHGNRNHNSTRSRRTPQLGRHRASPPAHRHRKTAPRKSGKDTRGGWHAQALEAAVRWTPGEQGLGATWVRNCVCVVPPTNDHPPAPPARRIPPLPRWTPARRGRGGCWHGRGSKPAANGAGLSRRVVSGATRRNQKIIYENEHSSAASELALIPFDTDTHTPRYRRYTRRRWSRPPRRPAAASRSASRSSPTSGAAVADVARVLHSYINTRSSTQESGFKCLLITRRAISAGP